MHWQGLNLPATYEPPLRLNRYIAFRASGASGPGGDWQGLIAMDDWVFSVAPSLARLAAAQNHDEQLLKLFAATPQALALPDVLAYSTLHVERLVDGAELPDVALPCMTTAQGRVWLQTVPEMAAPGVATVMPGVEDFPLLLEFELGSSSISTSLLSRLAAGDALFVSRVTPRIASQGMTVGRYVWTKEGVIVDQLQENSDDELFAEDGALSNQMRDEVGDNAGGEAGDGVGNVSQRSLARLPVRLEFTLGKKLITVGELSQLTVGQLLELAPGAEKRIVVSANGVLLGHGELIQLDDRLAVEINQWYGGNSDA